jgi:hypothetical protein
MTDVRAAAQLSALASLLTIAVPSLIAFNVIHATLALTVGLAAALLLLDRLGWRIAAVMFDRERLITGTPVIRGGPPALAAIRRKARHKRTFCRRDRYLGARALFGDPLARQAQKPPTHRDQRQLPAQRTRSRLLGPAVRGKGRAGR